MLKTRFFKCPAKHVYFICTVPVGNAKGVLNCFFPESCSDFHQVLGRVKQDGSDGRTALPAPGDALWEQWSVVCIPEGQVLQHNVHEQVDRKSWAGDTDNQHHLYCHVRYSSKSPKTNQENLFFMLFVFLYVCAQTVLLPVTFDLYKVKYSYLVCIFLRSETFRWHQYWSHCDLDPMIPWWGGVFYIWQATAVEVGHIESCFHYRDWILRHLAARQLSMNNRLWRWPLGESLDLDCSMFSQVYCLLFM